MSRRTTFPPTLAVLALFVALSGCGPKEPSPATPEQPAVGGTAEHAGHEHAKPAETNPEIEAAMAKLSEADRAAAEKQKVCPVSGEPLGSMGTPVKITVEGRDVFLCCAHCEDAIKADPQKYLAKLDE